MSRIGRMPIPLPSGVKVTIKESQVTVEGPRGELSRQFHPDIQIKQEANTVLVSRSSDERQARALHGLSRALLSNMVVGVSDGFRKELQIEGVGYRGVMEGAALVLSLGFSHPVRLEPPAGIQFSANERARTITVEGIDREQVGQVAADIRKIRPPEPYKGKGIRYSGEKVRRKAGKAGKVS
ncbi:MAG: 50S ribosomal protein L6 [Thermoflexales bacterium]|nr:50S ribosomal protein L6 [Thermoflexales bacterium]